MIIRCLFLYLLLLFPAMCSSQETGTDYVRDAYGLPLFDLTEEDSLYYTYITTRGERLKVRRFGVEFRGGRDSLYDYVMSAYYKQRNDDMDSYQIMLFYILFDKELQIKEIRQYPHKFIYKEERNRKLFTSILESTSGRWYKLVGGDEWYLYAFITRRY